MSVASDNFSTHKDPLAIGELVSAKSSTDFTQGKQVRFFLKSSSVQYLWMSAIKTKSYIAKPVMGDHSYGQGKHWE